MARSKAGYAILIRHASGKSQWHGEQLDGLRRFTTAEKARANLGAALSVKDARLTITEGGAVEAPRTPVGPIASPRLVNSVVSAELSEEDYAGTRRAYLVGTTAHVVRIDAQGRPVDPDGDYKE